MVGGPEVNDNESTAGVAISAFAILTPLAFLAVGARFYSRYFLTRQGGLDDVLIAISLGTALILGIMNIEEVVHGTGHHTSSMSSEHLSQSQKYRYEAMIPYFVSLAFIKSSLLLQYLRTFRSSTLRFLCWSMLLFESSFAFATVLVSFLLCRPMKMFWDASITEGKCLNINAFAIASTAIGIFTECVLVLMPAPWLHAVHLSKREMSVLIGVFGMGIAVFILGILRLNSLVRMAHTEDPSWEEPFAESWAYAEVTIAILAVCLPTYRPLVRRFFPNALGQRPHEAYEIEMQNRRAAEKEAEHMHDDDYWVHEIEVHATEEVTEHEPSHSRNGSDDKSMSSKTQTLTTLHPVHTAPSTCAESSYSSFKRRSLGSTQRLERWESTLPTDAEKGWVVQDEDAYLAQRKLEREMRKLKEAAIAAAAAAQEAAERSSHEQPDTGDGEEKKRRRDK